MVHADSVKVVDSSPNRTVLELSVHEGRKHVVRRALAAVGHPVTRLVRVGVGPIWLGDLKPGRRRRLQPGEVRSLYRVVDLSLD
jgi:23S rRNA pseudouridine2605 synthase